MTQVTGKVIAGLIGFMAFGPAGLLFASFGTDGEDGPTSAAGGFIDSPVAATFKHQPAALSHAIDRCDAHPLLAAAGGLIETGPTGTNVADVRIMLMRPGRA